MSVSLVVVSLGLFLSEYRVEALAGNLDIPSLGFPSEMKETTREQIMAAIVDKSYQFIDGHFVNAFTTLRYGGEMKGLNRFLEKLAECEGMKVVITYSKSLSNRIDPSINPTCGELPSMSGHKSLDKGVSWP